MFLFCILIWEFFCREFKVPVFILPPPSHVVAIGISKMSLLWLHTKVFLLEVSVGFVLSTLIGCILASLSFYIKRTKNVIEPAIVFLQSIPRLALAPFIIIFLGFGLGPKIFFSVFMGFLAVYFGTYKGLSNVEQSILDVSKVSGATEIQVFEKVIIPSTLPDFFAGLKISVPAVVSGAVVGEWIVGDLGLGYLVFLTINMFDVPLAFAAIFLLSIVSLSLYKIVCFIESFLTEVR